MKEWRRAVDEAVREAAVVAEQRMKTYLIASVYGTVPGLVYERTQNALRSLEARLVQQGSGTYLLMLADNAPYASAIELGNQKSYFEQAHGLDIVPQISAEELAMLMDGVAEDQRGEPHPEAFFRRSGLNYQAPGPHVTPAAVAAQYEFMRRLEGKLTRL